MHEQRDFVVATLLDDDVDGVGILGEAARDVLGDCDRACADDAVAVGTDLVDEVVVVSSSSKSSSTRFGST